MIALFGQQTTFADAHDRLRAVEHEAPVSDTEKAAALWQIAYELDRIASALEEAHK